MARLKGWLGWLLCLLELHYWEYTTAWRDEYRWPKESPNRWRRMCLNCDKQQVWVPTRHGITAGIWRDEVTNAH